MKTLKILLLCFASLLIASCQDLTSSKRYDENYFVTCLLEADTYVDFNNPVLVTTSQDVNEFNINDIMISGAAVKLIDMTRQDSIFLQENTFEVGDVTYSFYYDTQQELPIVAEHQYRLEVQIPNYEPLIYAETIVPKSSELLLDSAFASVEPESEELFPTIKFDTANQAHPLQIKTDFSESQVMLFRFYCLDDDWQNLEYTMDIPGLEDHPEEEDQFEDPATGQPRKIEFIARYLPHQNTDGEYVIEDRGYATNLWFYARYEITILAIDNNYFEYKYKPEGFKFGGIHNAYGFFGSSSGSKAYTKVIP